MEAGSAQKWSLYDFWSDVLKYFSISHFPHNSCCIFIDFSILYSSQMGLFHVPAPILYKAFQVECDLIFNRPSTIRFIPFYIFIFFTRHVAFGKVWSASNLDDKSRLLHPDASVSPTSSCHSGSFCLTSSCADRKMYSINDQAIENALSRSKMCVECKDTHLWYWCHMTLAMVWCFCPVPNMWTVH